MIQLSVIIPVYNVGKYIRQCLDSLMSSTFQEWECILVDDGSIDDSGIICDEYVKTDSRFKVIHKINGGVSSARNLGLDNASGKWVTFIDADDFISPTFIECLYEPIKEHPDLDFVHGGCSNWSGGKVTGINQQYDDYVGSDMAYLFNKFRGLTVSKLFSLENVRTWSNGLSLRFDEKMRMAEDMAFTLDYLLTVHKYAFVSETGYYYRNDNVLSATKQGQIIQYEEQNHSFRHLYDSTIRFINLCRLDEKDCTYRYQQRAFGLLSLLDSLYYSNIKRTDRISILTSNDTTRLFFLFKTIKGNSYQERCIQLLLSGNHSKYDLIQVIHFSKLTIRRLIKSVVGKFLGFTIIRK